MIVKKFENRNPQKLSKILSEELGVRYNLIWKLLKHKDVKVNGARVSKDVLINVGEIVEVYLPEEKPIVVFENNDLIVARKPQGVETINETGDDFKTLVQNYVKQEIFAVHRLDRNTEGLVIFAKNERAKTSLDKAIKNRKIEKFYLAEVVGVPEIEEQKLVAYLKKDAEKSKVCVSDEKLAGFEEIKTNYKMITNSDVFSILEVELVTGKTHQIRAHLSHIGLPILGDEKYGNSSVNKKFKKKYQCLCAFKLVFHFEKQDYLFYLNEKIVEIDKNDISFYKNFK